MEGGKEVGVGRGGSRRAGKGREKAGVGGRWKCILGWNTPKGKIAGGNYKRFAIDIKF